MTYENNRRYTAESWLDNKKEEEFKTSYLKSLFEQKEGHNNGFNADMVDGFHAEQIFDEISESTKNLLSSFNIGYTNFSNFNNIEKYYLGFEAIKLYNNQFEGQTEDEMLLPWERSQEAIELFNEEQPPSLSAVLYKLYDLTYFKDKNGKTNNEIYNEYVDIINNIDERVGDIESALDGKLIPDPYNENRMLLNSDSVNGIRFFIKTPEEYRRLKENANAYAEDNSKTQYKNDYKLINSVHNVFIIKSEDEIRASGYDTGVYPGNPDSPVMTRSYQFRVQDGKVQYAYIPDGAENPDDYWTDLADVDDFVSEDRVKEELLEILADEDSYSLNKDAVLTQYHKFTATELLKTANAPTALKNILGNYISGGFYTDEQNQKQEINETTEQIQIAENVYAEGRYLDLTNLRNELKSNATSIEDRIASEINEIRETISTTNGNLSTLDTEVKRIRDNAEQTVTLQSLQTNLNTLSTQLQNLSTELTEYKQQNSWILYHQENPNDNFVKKTDSRIYYSLNRKLCYFRLKTTIKKAKDWVTISPALPAFLHPVYDTMLLSSRADTLARINVSQSTYEGKVQIYTNNTVPLEVVVSGFYIYKGDS